MSDDRVTMVQSFFQHCFEGQVDVAAAMLSPGAELHVFGAPPDYGVALGAPAVAEHLRTFLRLSRGHVDVLKWEDWLAGVSHVAGIVRYELQRPGRVQAFRAVFVVGVSEGRTIDRVEVFLSDQKAFERFISW